MMNFSLGSSGAAKPKPQTGQKGVSYGLQKAPSKPKSLFTIDDDDELNVNSRIQLEAQARSSEKKTQKALEQALAEDPMAFEYDGVYKEMKKEAILARGSTKDQGKPKPKYMDRLMKNSELKKQQDMLVLQKKLQRELQEEKELFGDDQAKFITATYKKQLELNKIFEEQIRQKEERDKAHTIEGRGHMGEFFKNLLDSRSSGREIKTFEDEEKAKEEQRGRKRDREGSDDDETRVRSDSRERERVARLRERAAKDAVEAEKLRVEREKAQEEKLKELQEKYAKHATSETEVQSARERYLARKRQRTEGASETNES